MKLPGIVGMSNEQLINFGSDPDIFLDPGFFKGFIFSLHSS